MSKPALSRQTREPVSNQALPGRALLPSGWGAASRKRDQPNPGADCAKDYEHQRAPRAPVFRRLAAASCRFYLKIKRLSATDISALASMKNVAKCDTWCELQNPVNHRVFERKLRPKPSGRGHVCLGVTHRVAPLPPGGEGRRLASRASRRAAGLNADPAAAKSRDDWWC